MPTRQCARPERNRSPGCSQWINTAPRAEQDEGALELATALLPAIETYHFEASARLWPVFDAACSHCLACVLARHSSHGALEAQGCTLADAMLISRAEAVSATLCGAEEKAEELAAAGRALQPEAPLVHALLEVLLFHRLLQDQGLLSLGLGIPHPCNSPFVPAPIQLAYTRTC